MTVGPDGACWFTNTAFSSIGRITRSAKITRFSGNSIGPIATSGLARVFTGAGIDEPDSITTGPAGALWSTNSANNSIGRITAIGKATNYTDVVRV
jgi:virginiamycin B lyase